MVVLQHYKTFPGEVYSRESVSLTKLIALYKHYETRTAIISFLSPCIPEMN